VPALVPALVPAPTDGCHGCVRGLLNRLNQRAKKQRGLVGATRATCKRLIQQPTAKSKARYTARNPGPRRTASKGWLIE
jgi:hypothetical protein